MSHLEVYATQAQLWMEGLGSGSWGFVERLFFWIPRRIVTSTTPGLTMCRKSTGKWHELKAVLELAHFFSMRPPVYIAVCFGAFSVSGRWYAKDSPNTLNLKPIVCEVQVRSTSLLPSWKTSTRQVLLDDGVSKIRGRLFGGTYNQDCSAVGQSKMHFLMGSSM